MAEPMVPEQSYEDVVASVEEARLWDVVTVDFLDFDAWTAFIQETERIAESNILKIRKVNDAFLAGFPLCFGYWKKYADHEGRLDGFNKVFEVYERAVLAVTYSVDVWCNYCQFAISTYNDPDVIRRWRDFVRADGGDQGKHSGARCSRATIASNARSQTPPLLMEVSCVRCYKETFFTDYSTDVGRT